MLLFVDLNIFLFILFCAEDLDHAHPAASSSRPCNTFRLSQGLC